jgi:hypothetical protein
MNERFPLLVRRAVYNMRGGFLVRPLTIALSLGCAGALLSWIEEAVPGFSDWVPAVIFPTHADPQVAQVILAGIAASIMTVVSIVFAILLMTLTLASMQFSPRIILSFTRDRVTQWTLGIFLLHGGASGGTRPPEPIFAGRHRPGRNAAGARLRILVAFFHTPHRAGHQREPDSGQDRR